MRPLRALRQLVAPTGKHRAIVMLQPAEAMANDRGWCWSEGRETLHAYLRTGGRVCWDCRAKTESDELNPVATPGGAA